MEVSLQNGAYEFEPIQAALDQVLELDDTAAYASLYSVAQPLAR